MTFLRIKDRQRPGWRTVSDQHTSIGATVFLTHKMMSKWVSAWLFLHDDILSFARWHQFLSMASWHLLTLILTLQQKHGLWIWHWRHFDDDTHTHTHEILWGESSFSTAVSFSLDGRYHDPCISTCTFGKILFEFIWNYTNLISSNLP